MNKKLPSPNLPAWIQEATRLSRAGKSAEALSVLKAGAGRAGPLPGVRGLAGLTGSRSVFGSRLPSGTAAFDSLASGAGLRQPATAPLRTEHADGSLLLAGTHDTARHGSRDYRLRVPSDAATGGKRPLIVMLHGCTQDADDFARGTRMDTIAGEQGCFVLFPEQSARANPQRCWNWFKHTHQSAERGEPAILLGMIDELVDTHPIDARRVFVAGLSAGGAMAAVLADVAPERIAAVGIHSGLAAGAADDMPSAFAAMQGRSEATLRASGVPTIVLHGDADSTVHADNALGIVAAMEGASNGLLRHERALRDNGRRVTVASFSCPAGRSRMEHWHIEGAGHAWSGGDPAGSYTDATGPDASREMLRFFLGQDEVRRNVA